MDHISVQAAHAGVRAYRELQSTLVLGYSDEGLEGETHRRINPFNTVLKYTVGAVARISEFILLLVRLHFLTSIYISFHYVLK